MSPPADPREPAPGTAAPDPARVQVLGARREHLDGARRLVAEAGLPPLDPHVRVSDVCVAVTDDEEVVGCVGLEVRARTGWIRAMVVREPYRGAGVGRELFTTMRSRASELSLRELYVLASGDAATFFRELGFRPVEPESAPHAIRSLEAFRAAGSGDAGLWRLPL